MQAASDRILAQRLILVAAHREFPSDGRVSYTGRGIDAGAPLTWPVAVSNLLRCHGHEKQPSTTVPSDRDRLSGCIRRPRRWIRRR
jgi:hypothetical protein